MSNYKLIPELINIVFLNPDYFSDIKDFEKEFKIFTEENELSFEKKPIEVITKQGRSIPKELLKETISTFYNEEDRLYVELLLTFPNSKLNIVMKDIESFEPSDVKKMTDIAKKIVSEFRSQYNSVGFNFKYKIELLNQLHNDVINQSLRNINNKVSQINNFNIKFNLEENIGKNTNHLISLDIFKPEDNNEIIVSVNFHYEKFEQNVSKSKRCELINEEIMPMMSENFNKFEELIKNLMEDNKVE